jgi:hypothetical protein
MEKIGENLILPKVLEKLQENFIKVLLKLDQIKP